MPDSIPKHNKNIVHLTEVLSDAVSGGDNGVKAATDGARFSSTFREQCMADSYAWCVGEVIRRRPNDAKVVISGAVVSYTLAQVTAGIALPADYLTPLSVVRSTAGTPPYKYIPPDMKGDADMDNLPDSKRVYTILGNTLYSYTRTNGILTADNSINLLLYYFKRERINYTDGTLIATNTADSRSADITLEPQFHEICVYYAGYLAAMREGSSDWQTKGALWYKVANDKLGMILGVAQ